MVAGEQVLASVRRLLAPNPSPMTLSGTNSYLVGRGEVVVVDPGPDLPEHVDALVAAAATLGRLAYSVVTHHHADHLPAAARLRERVGSPIVGHPDLPGVDRPCVDGEILETSGARLRALATPGHTADHVCYFLEDERALFTGDLIAGEGTVIVGEGRGDLVDYMDSLRRIAELEPRMLLPGHGPPVADAPAKIREYLEHRHLRERQIVALLNEGPTTIDELVRRLYADTPPNLHPMAARNVRAHLFKLEHEGAVSVAEDRWRLSEAGVGR